MAFTGVAVVKQVADNLVRITGLSLVDGASGTIGLFEKAAPAPDVRLPESFKPRAYASPVGADVSLADSIEVSVYPTAMGNTAIPINITKAGTQPTDFLVTLDAAAAAETNTGALEIYVRHH